MKFTIASLWDWIAGAFTVHLQGRGIIVRPAIRAVGLLLGLVLVFLPVSVSAQTTYNYWISMRNFATDPGPIYVVASPTQTAQQTVALQACDGNTYYLAAADNSTLQGELQNQAAVQLNTSTGTDPPVSSLVCLIQAP
jgi:hypothetical protein